MKKTLKRTLAIVMAVAMLFALSVSVFAAGSVSMQIVLFSYEMDAEQFNYLNNNTTVYDAVVATYGTYSPSWKPGITPKILTGMTIDENAYVSRAMDADERVAFNVPTATWSNNPDYAGYGLISEVNGVYTYIYAGFDWTYTVNGNPVYDYMNEYNLSNGDVVVLTYSEQIVTWPQENPIPDFILPE